MIERRGLRQDSGGAGKHRGGLGIELHVRNFAPGLWNLNRPYRQGLKDWGLWGGKGGATANYIERKPGENEFHEQYGHRTPMPADTEVISRHPGGGGWGDPLDRDAEAVRWDVVEQYVSRQAAQDDYGVVLTDDLVLDAAATEKLRGELRAKHVDDGSAPKQTGDAYLTDLTVFATGIN